MFVEIAEIILILYCVACWEVCSFFVFLFWRRFWDEHGARLVLGIILSPIGVVWCAVENLYSLGRKLTYGSKGVENE